MNRFLYKDYAFGQHKCEANSDPTVCAGAKCFASINRLFTTTTAESCADVGGYTFIDWEML